MKKVKIIFPDGSVGEVDEADVKDALAAGAKLYTDKGASATKPKQTAVIFADGSAGQIDEADYDSAVKSGAVKKKDGGTSSATTLQDGGQSNSDGESDEYKRLDSVARKDTRFRDLYGKLYITSGGTLSEIKEFNALADKYGFSNRKVSEDEATDKPKFETDPNAYLKQFGQQQPATAPKVADDQFSSRAIAAKAGGGFQSKSSPKELETKLSSSEEKQFQSWFDENHKAGTITKGDYDFYKKNGYGKNYDFRAAFKAGEGPSVSDVDGEFHWSDIGKKPNHPTFSNESKYSGVNGREGGSWDGEIFRPVDETSANPYSPILKEIQKARPNDAATQASLYEQIVGGIQSGDEGKIKTAKTEYAKILQESNPDVLTPADKAELIRVTGTDDPAKQLQVLDARLGKQTESGEITGMVLNPLVGIDIASLPSADNEKLGLYRDKLAYNTNPDLKKNTKWSNKNILTKGGEQTTELENFLNLTGGVSGLTNASVEEAKRYNAEKLTDSFSTGLESIKTSDPARYKRVTEAIEQGKPLATTDVVDLTAQGTKVIQRQNSQDIIDGKIDIDQFTTDQEDLAKTQEQNVYGHPDFLRTVMSGTISEYYADKGTIVAGPWMITDKQIDAVPKELFLAQGLDPNNPEFKKQLQFLKEKEGWFPFQNSIAKNDLLREFRSGALSTFKGVLSTAESITADVIDAEDALKVDSEVKRGFGKYAPANLSDIGTQRGKYFDDNYGKWADAFSGFGQFTSQLALMYAGGAGAAAAGEALGGGTVAARLLGASRMEKLGNLLVDNAQLYGTYGTSFVQSYGDYYKDALSKGANSLHAKMMAFTNASMEGVSETIFDNVKFGKQVAKDLLDKRNFDKIAKVFDRGVWDDIAKKEYSAIVQDVSSQAWKTLKTVAKAGGAAAKESFEEVPVAVTNFVVDAANNPSNVKGRDVLLEAKDAFMDGLVSFSIPSLLGLAGGLRQQLASEKSANESLMIAAMQHPYMVESINRLVQSGDITQEQANQKLKVVNTAAQELQRIPKVNSKDEALTPEEREKYLSLSVKEKVLENSLADNDKAAQKIINGKINDILAEKDAILNKSVAEVVKETAKTEGPPQDGFVVAEEERLSDDNEILAFQNALVSGKKSFTDLFIDRTKPKTSMQALKEQSIDAPNSLLESLNKDQDAVTDIIALNDEAAINAGIQKWTDAITNETHTPEEADAHITLLEEGLAKKQAAATKSPMQAELDALNKRAKNNPDYQTGSRYTDESRAIREKYEPKSDASTPSKEVVDKKAEKQKEIDDYKEARYKEDADSEVYGYKREHKENEKSVFFTDENGTLYKRHDFGAGGITFVEVDRSKEYDDLKQIKERELPNGKRMRQLSNKDAVPLVLEDVRKTEVRNPNYFKNVLSDKYAELSELEKANPPSKEVADEAPNLGRDVKAQSQDEFAQYLQDNHSDKLSQEQIYKLLTVRPELRERMLNNSPEEWAKIFEKNKDYREQHNNVDNNKEMRGTSNPAWTGISIGNPANTETDGRHKGYVTLDVTSAREMAKNVEQTFKDLFKALKDAGYNGHLKMPGTFSDLLTRFDNIVIHGASQKDVNIALPIIEKYFKDKGLTVEGTKTGVDSKDSKGKETSHTNLLAEKVKNKTLPKPSSKSSTPQAKELTVAEKKDWDGLSMGDKRKLATENLPEAKTDMADKEIVELADSNAKYLLAKMRGENISRPVELNPNLPEGYKLPGQKEESVKQEKQPSKSEKLDELDNKYGVKYAASLGQLIDLLKPRRLSAGDYALLGENRYIPIKNLKAYRNELAELEKTEPQAKEQDEKADEPEQKEEQLIPEVKKFEHPEMENPVYRVTVGDHETFIQRSEGMNPGDTAWYEVKKFGKEWKSPKGQVGVMADGFRGFTKKEAVASITADVKAEKESAKPTKPKVRVSAEQVESGQPQQEKDAIPEGEYNTFVDKGVVTAERLNSIADKVMAQEQLSGREMEMLSAKTSEVNDELKKRFAEAAKEKVKEEFTPEEKNKFSDALFAFADKILKADPTGSGGSSAMTNLFKIPQEILGRAVQAVALAVKGGELLAVAVKKGIAIIREAKHQVDEDDFTGLVKSVMAGQKPKMGTVRPPSFSTMAAVPSSAEYTESMDTPETDDPIAAYHMTRSTEIPKMFGADKTQQNVFDSLPSEERFRAQMDMIQDGKALMAAAQSKFGSTDVLVYGPQLLNYINKSKEFDAGLTNKRAVMLATLLGEVKQDLLTNKNPDRQDALQQFDKRLSTVYNQFMHVTAKNLSAARLLRVFRDKYMADIFHDKILEEQQIRDRDNITEEEADTDISDADALAHQEKPRDKPDVKAQQQDRKQKQAEADKRKKSPKNEYDKKASEKEDDIKKKYGGKNKLIENVIDRIKKLNCK